MRLALLALLLASCGALGLEEDVVNKITVRRYEDVNGHPTRDPNSLGFTYYAGQHSSAKHGAKGYNCLINEMLLNDDDSDKIVRVIIHELGQVLILKDDDAPTYEPGWYTFDSDVLPPQAQIPVDEAMWFAHHDTMQVSVHDAWLAGPVGEAIDRINYAAEFWSSGPVMERR